MVEEAVRLPAREAGIRGGGEGVLVLHGAWKVLRLADLEKRIPRFPWPPGEQLTLDAGSIEGMDTAGAWLLARTMEELRGKGKQVFLRSLRPEHAELLKMVAESRKGRRPPGPPKVPGGLEIVGRRAVTALQGGAGALSFIGESASVLVRSAANPRRIRWRAILSNLETGGFHAIPITGLLVFLMGIVISYQAAVQLRQFGANIFIVDLVGISVLREIAPLVTAIIVAGRSGSAYTAEIGTMMVNEEVDALRTLGISPIDLLVLPKTVALVLSVPLLTVYADFMGVFGGMVMARNQLGVGYADFLNRFQDVIQVKHYLIGIGKAPVFALIIVMVGCYQGFQVAGGADAVGRHTTISVVQAIFLVIVTDALFSILFNWVGLGL